MKKKLWTIAVVAVGLVLLTIVGIKWKEMRAWYVLKTDFERLPSKAEGSREFKHKRTGIVFIVKTKKS